MQKLHFLNAKEKKELFQQLEKQFGARLDVHALLFENSQDKIFFLSPQYTALDTQPLRINNSGMYFAKREREGLRLSIEGAQLLHATKNVIPFTKKQTEQWMCGDDISLLGNAGFVIVENEGDVLGCGLLKNDILRNMVPKERRLHSVTETEEEKF